MPNSMDCTRPTFIAELQEGRKAAATGVSLMNNVVKNEVVVRGKEIPQTWHEVPLIQEDVFLSANHRKAGHYQACSKDC